MQFRPLCLAVAAALALHAIAASPARAATAFDAAAQGWW